MALKKWKDARQLFNAFAKDAKYLAHRKRASISKNDPAKIVDKMLEKTTSPKEPERVKIIITDVRGIRTAVALEPAKAQAACAELQKQGLVTKVSRFVPTTIKVKLQNLRTGTVAQMFIEETELLRFSKKMGALGYLVFQH